jgi:hypothetical protein
MMSGKWSLTYMYTLNRLSIDIGPYPILVHLFLANLLLIARENISHSQAARLCMCLEITFFMVKNHVLLKATISSFLFIASPRYQTCYVSPALATY